MIPWLLLLPLPLPALAGVDKTFGVRPDLIPKYAPLSNGNWKCLDGSKEIPWSFVNDDSCDCPDGSDEPGTGACPNTVFYCQNKGHIGSTIPSSRVKDGLCEPDCCDGSDERPGVCPNRCKEIGEEYKKKRDAERKLRKTGAKIRSTYITFAHKEQKRLEALMESTSQSIEAQEKEVARLKDIAERTEALSQAALEHKQASPLYTTLMEHSAALKALQQEHKKHLEREKALGDILSTLRSGYNPNYQDMAVLEAVRGWEELAKLSHINDVGKDSTTAETTEATAAESNEENKDDDDDDDDDAWTPERLEKDLDNLLNVDHISLLMAHDEHVRTPAVEPSILFDITSYLPDSIIPQYEELKESFVNLLRTFGIVRGSDDAAANDSSARARQAFRDADRDLNTLKDQKKETAQDLAEIFDPAKFGPEGEWKKLDGLCLERDDGDYTYELCFFDEARQKPKNGGPVFSLGRFQSWNPSPDVKPGEPTYYGKQVYQHGARCWNGPERSVVLLLSCGTENALLSVQELEKCEYQFTGTTPALCLPLKDEKKSNKDEL